MRFRYDMSRPKFDHISAIELGEIDHGYREINFRNRDEHLYSLTCPLMLGVIIVAIPKHTRGQLAVVPKNKRGQPLSSRVEALDAPHENSGYLLAPPGSLDKSSVAAVGEPGALREIKEWQAIMDHLGSFPVKNPGELPMVPVDKRASEVRAIKIGIS